MSRRKKSEIKTDKTDSDDIKLIFTKTYTFQLKKSQLLSDDEKKLTDFIENTLRYVYTFSYPYEMVYYENDKEICNSIRSDESIKSIGYLLKELIDSDKGKELKEVYFFADKRGIKTWIYYNVDFVSFFFFVFSALWCIITYSDESRYSLYFTGSILISRLVKYVR